MKWQQRAGRTAPTAQGQARTGPARNGEAADLREHPAWWRRGYSDAGKCSTGHEQTADPSHDCSGYWRFLPMNTTSIPAGDCGATSMKVSVTVVVNRLEMTTAMAFMKCTSTCWKAVGPD